MEDNNKTLLGENSIPQQTSEEALQAERLDEQKKNTSDSKPRALLETLWFGLDYGSILTAFALYEAVGGLGWDVSLMNKSPDMWTENYGDPDGIAGEFIYKYCNVEPAAADEEDLKNIVENKDAVIVGSDIIWNYKICGEQTGTHYYLDYVPDDKKKISYATSFGYSYSVPYGDEMIKCSKLLKGFDGVSVNNFYNLEVLQNRFGVEGETVIDPVFLCDKALYEKAAGEALGQFEESESSFIFTYIKAGNPRKKQFILRGAEIFTKGGISPIRSFVNINVFLESVEMFGMDVSCSISVEDWLYYIINSRFVITDDYYGVCFALIFNKPFVFIESLSFDGLNNVKALLSSLDLEERIVYLEDDFRKKEYLFRLPVRYNKVNKLLDEMKEQSLSWLKNKLCSKEADSIG